ncbi:MAG TPA: hypothetical protein VGO84_13935, partial [Burkholderiales bacterium]|nr:hypothetical protein [Burkholderiales bacterium]
LLAAYTLGATLWAPAIVLIAGQFEGAFVRFIPGFPFAGAARMLALVWALRFAFYLVGASRNADYGYGINGVIVNPSLALAEKVRRIARDWFGLVLIAVWIGFAAVALLAFTGGN